jgi:CelD/BcsL family acetyltransferase involved in cellulose biosynthesis
MPTAGLPHAPPKLPEPQRSPLQVEAITTLAALAQLEPAWWRLWTAARGSPFQSPAWLLPWWKHIGQGQLAGVAVHDTVTGELVALAPLYVYTDAATGRRHLFPLGVATSDRLDVLVRPGWEAAGGEALVAQFAVQAESWDVLEAPQLAEGAALSRLPWPATWRRELEDSDPNPVLPLPGCVPAGMVRALRYARRQAERATTVAYEQVQGDGVPAMLETLAHLHARRWAERDQPGVLSDPRVLAAHREAAPLLDGAGLLRLLALRLDGEVAAVLYALADPAGWPRRRWSFYIAGFDPARAALSPGSLLIGHAIDQAQAEGAMVFDFLRGAEAYKRRWGAVDQRMVALRVGRT